MRLVRGFLLLAGYAKRKDRSSAARQCYVLHVKVNVESAHVLAVGSLD